MRISIIEITIPRFQTVLIDGIMMMKIMKNVLINKQLNELSVCVCVYVCAHARNSASVGAG